jgi:hypothetical protein
MAVTWAAFGVAALGAGSLVGCSAASSTDPTQDQTLANDAHAVISQLVPVDDGGMTYTPPPPSPVCTDDLSGRATALVVDVLDGKVHLVAADTGLLPSAGGDIVASTLNTNIPDFVSTTVLHSMAHGLGEAVNTDVTTSVTIALSQLQPYLDSLSLKANLDELGLSELSGLADLMLPDIVAEVVTSSAAATCDNGAATASARAIVAKLTIAGKSYDLKGKQNEVIPLGPLTITVNENVQSSALHFARADARALHVHVDHLVDVVVSDAEADITCLCFGG